MLIGEFDSKITEKNRLAIPKKFRLELGDKLVLTQGYDGCMILVDEEKFLALTKEITEGRFINDAVRDLSRFLVGSAHEITLDKQGRFVLPQSLIEFSEVKIETTFIGLLRWVEIWSKEKWLQKKKLVSENASMIAEKLEESLNKTNHE